MSAEIPPADLSVQDIPGRAKKGTILILEDQRGFRRVYRDLLESEDYTVLEAADGEEGWDVITTQKPSLVLLDLGLPLLDGFQILEKIRRSEQTKNIPVIIFSVLGEPRNVKKAMEMGANDYTVKGFYTPRQILSKIKTLLKDSSLQSGINSYRLRIEKNSPSYSQLDNDLGLGSSFSCPHCHTEMEVEFFPDYARADGHWFAARFTCPSCGKPF
jgi:DNA-binding response OmpR family regulator